MRPTKNRGTHNFLPTMPRFACANYYFFHITYGRSNKLVVNACPWGLQEDFTALCMSVAKWEQTWCCPIKQFILVHKEQE